MRLLLDESVPRALGFALEGHFVRTVQSVGFAGYTIGKLLTHMQQQGFDVLITFDQNLPYQQNASLPVGVVVLVARNNRVQTALAFAPLLLETLKAGQLKQVIRLELAPSV